MKTMRDSFWNNFASILIVKFESVSKFESKKNYVDPNPEKKSFVSLTTGGAAKYFRNAEAATFVVAPGR
jgi:hypothetical protein